MSQQEVLNIGVATKARGFDSLDPEDDHTGRQNFSMNNLVQHGLYDRLIYFKTDMGTDLRPTFDLSRLEPGLAEHWDQSKDGKLLTVLLRRDVLSSRGHRLTSRSVKWSVGRAFARHAVGEWVYRLAGIDGPDAVEILDDRTFRLRLSRPDFFLPVALGRPVPTLYDSEEAEKHVTASDPWAYGWISRNDAGFGPYIAEDFKPDEPVTFVSNSNYWGGTAPIKRLTLTFGTWEELADKLIGGAIDIISNIPVSLAKRLETRDEVKLVQHWQGAIELPLRLNCRLPPLSDKRIRQAIAFAIPYQRIIDEIFRGLARPFRSPAYLPEEPNQPLPYETNITTARDLLKKAGYPNGFETELYYVIGEELEELVKALVEWLAEVGIRVNAKALSGREYRADVGGTGSFGSGGSMYARKGRWPMVLRPGGYRLPDPRYAVPHDFGQGSMGLANDAGYENPAISELWQRAHADPNPEVYNRTLREAEKILIEDAPFVWLAKPARITALRREVQGNHAWYVTSRGDPLFHRLVKESV